MSYCSHVILHMNTYLNLRFSYELCISEMVLSEDRLMLVDTRLRR